MLGDARSARYLFWVSLALVFAPWPFLLLAFWPGGLSGGWGTYAVRVAALVAVPLAANVAAGVRLQREEESRFLRLGNVFLWLLVVVAAVAAHGLPYLYHGWVAAA